MERKYKECHSTDKRNFDKESFETFMKEYKKWNLTSEEKDQIVNDTIEEINKSDNQDLACAKAEKELSKKYKKARNEEISLELKLKEHEKKINNALRQASEKLDKELANVEQDGRLIRLLEDERNRVRPNGRLTADQKKEITLRFVEVVKAERHSEVYKRIKAIIKAEEAILAETIKVAGDGNNGRVMLTLEEVEQVIDAQSFPFTSEERVELRLFSVGVLELDVRHYDAIGQVSQRRSFVVSAETVYEKKKMVLRQLLNEFPGSKFQRVKSPKPAEMSNVLNPAPANPALMQKAQEESQAKLNTKLADLEAHWAEQKDSKIGAREKKQLRANARRHYSTIEKSRIYERLMLEEMFPAYVDKRKFKKSDRTA